MNKKIKVISVQLTPQKNASIENCINAEKIISDANQTSFDLIVLPEFFNTGTNYKNSEFINQAEVENDSNVLRRMSKLAQDYNSYVLCGSILVKEEEKLFNRSYMMDRAGQIIAKYDKIHLFKYMGGNEDSYTAAGNELCVVETDFAKIGLATCFDLRFPSHFSKLVRMGAQIITLPAAWSIVNKATSEYKEQFIKNWCSMCVARALDNVAYLISSNNTGQIHPMFRGIGNSMIVDYDGKIIAQADENTEGFIMCELELDGLLKYRQGFPVETFND